jgi:hypothetical protein
MHEFGAVALTKTRPHRHPCDRLTEHYREIGISAVLAALCILSEPLPLKDTGISEERSATIPSVLRDEGFAD